jgi:hypothetical protein
MPRDAFHNPLTGAPCRAAKQWHAKNLRWMQLSAGEIMSRQNLHQCWAMHSLLVLSSYFLAGYAIALWSNLFGPIPAAMQQMIDYLVAWAGHYSQQATQ